MSTTSTNNNNNTSQQSGGAKMNRLAKEKSPYLLQHATNPVDWYPWSDEAFKKAKDENKPIFLSVGYSTCHWCHVMEHESFEDEAIANILNENFVSIKVDREERPDVDKFYMSFVQSLSGGGGWPMSVFLTPELEPISGGTYFPPRDSFGRLGFASVLTMISDKWKINNKEIKAQGRELAEAIREGMRPMENNGDAEKKLPSADTAFKACFDWLSKRFDSENGGFGSAPKFPKAVDLDFLLNFYSAKKPSEEADTALEMLRLTFEKMFEGGIHDHVGKGFHRYSVDSTWHVPHFEKMLYDQGQLLRSYSKFLQVTDSQQDKELAADAVSDIADYVNENLSHPLGGFYSAEDADSFPEPEAKHKREGAFCVWTKKEVENVLGDRPARHNENVCLDEIFCAAFGVFENGNVPASADPHQELKMQNILHLVIRPLLEAVAREHKMSLQQLRECISDAKRFLAEERTKRPMPHLDNKLVTAWNGLAISGFCAASSAIAGIDENLSNVYKERAERAVQFLREHLLLDGELLRSAYVDETGSIVQIASPIRAFADDYAFLVEALLDLYSLNFDETLLEWAEQLQRKMDSLFWDDDTKAGYFTSRADDPSIFARVVDEQDGAEPCATTVAVSNLIRLAVLLDVNEFQERAEAICTSRTWTLRLEKFAFAIPRLVVALHMLTNRPPRLTVVGSACDENTKKMLDAIRAKSVPLIFLDADKKQSESWLQRKSELLRDFLSFQKPDAPATVFVCQEESCELPITSFEELQKKLDTL